jgi:hypothetical protein
LKVYLPLIIFGVGGKQTVLDEAEELTRGIMSALVKPS